MARIGHKPELDVIGSGFRQNQGVSRADVLVALAVD